MLQAKLTIELCGRQERSMWTAYLRQAVVLDLSVNPIACTGAAMQQPRTAETDRSRLTGCRTALTWIKVENSTNAPSPRARIASSAQHWSSCVNVACGVGTLIAVSTLL